MRIFTESDFKAITKPPTFSHKGNNGRLLVIGGSELFHASIFWTADIASRMVDLVHFCSPNQENNDLVRQQAKAKFWNGIVVHWKDIDRYIEEDDCIVIGPGLPRSEGLEPGEKPTAQIVNDLLTKHPHKRWVVDGGALQECDPHLLNENMIITPHVGEWQRLIGKIQNPKSKIQNLHQVSNLKIEDVISAVVEVSKTFNLVTILLKGIEAKDIVCKGEEVIVIEGGNEGLTKGGTGDILAGLVGSFYCKDTSVLSAAAGSLVLKTAADRLYQSVGPYYNSSDLVTQIPSVIHKLGK